MRGEYLKPGVGAGHEGICESVVSKILVSYCISTPVPPLYFTFGNLHLFFELGVISMCMIVFVWLKVSTVCGKNEPGNNESIRNPVICTTGSLVFSFKFCS